MANAYVCRQCHAPTSIYEEIISLNVVELRSAERDPSGALVPTQRLRRKKPSVLTLTFVCRACGAHEDAFEKLAEET